MSEETESKVICPYYIEKNNVPVCVHMEIYQPFCDGNMELKENIYYCSNKVLNIVHRLELGTPIEIEILNLIHNPLRRKYLGELLVDSRRGVEIKK